jgi:glycosyltransferase involved in cell wall biosynthesis
VPPTTQPASANGSAPPEPVADLCVAVITLNEAARIGTALASARWAGELLVLDSGSEDATPDIARSLGARVVTRPFTDYADQRNAALAEAARAWVLFLDADETVTPGLAAEIARVLRAPGAVAGYEIPFKNYLGARWLRFGGLYPDHHLRLLRRSGARYVGRVHERVRVDGPVGRLAEPIEHRTYADRADLLRKVRRYAALEGRERAVRGESPLALLARVPWRFVQVLLLRSGWRDGADGWVHAWALTLYAWLVFRAATARAGA